MKIYFHSLSQSVRVRVRAKENVVQPTIIIKKMGQCPYLQYTRIYYPLLLVSVCVFFYYLVLTSWITFNVTAGEECKKKTNNNNNIKHKHMVNIFKGHKIRPKITFTIPQCSVSRLYFVVLFFTGTNLCVVVFTHFVG